jgi:hypothetical protein
MMYQAGLNPTLVERQAAASDALYHNREKMKAATRAFGDAMAEALSAGDGQAANVVIQRALAQGVDISNIFRSANSRERQERKLPAERFANPAALAEWRNVIGQ